MNLGVFNKLAGFFHGAEKDVIPARSVAPAQWDPLAAAADRRIDVNGISPRPVWRTEPRWDTVPLYRYDTRDPYFENIFSTGLLPRDRANLDLSSGGATAFVSTAQRREINWPGEYRYVIHAPGGIHVEPSLGMQGGSAYGGEVTFPGGVHPRYIRGAEVIDPERYDYGTFIPNPNFDPHGLGVPKPEDPWASW